MIFLEELKVKEEEMELETKFLEKSSAKSTNRVRTTTFTKVWLHKKEHKYLEAQYM
jgi:hypothetical protein